MLSAPIGYSSLLNDRLSIFATKFRSFAGRRRHTLRSILIISPVLALVINCGFAATLQRGKVAIIVNPGVPVNELSLSELRRVFMGERQYWNPSLRVTLILRGPISWERDAVLRTVYRMSEAQFRHYWIRKIFADEITTTPKIANSNERALQLVAQTPGAITFVDASQIPDGAKVVKILKSTALGIGTEKQLLH